MPANRMYISYASRNGSRDQGLSWAGIVMISLMLSAPEKMSCVNIVDDISDGRRETKEAIYASVWSALGSLEHQEYVHRDAQKMYKPTAKGNRVFKEHLDTAKNVPWRKLTDSKHLIQA